MEHRHRLTGAPSLDAAATGRRVLALLGTAEAHRAAERARVAAVASLNGGIPRWLSSVGVHADRLAAALAAGDPVTPAVHDEQPTPGLAGRPVVGAPTPLGRARDARRGAEPPPDPSCPTSLDPLDTPRRAASPGSDGPSRPAGAAPAVVADAFAAARAAARSTAVSSPTRPGRVVAALATPLATRLADRPASIGGALDERHAHRRRTGPHTHDPAALVDATAPASARPAMERSDHLPIVPLGESGTGAGHVRPVGSTPPIRNLAQLAERFGSEPATSPPSPPATAHTAPATGVHRRDLVADRPTRRADPERRADMVSPNDAAWPGTAASHDPVTEVFVAARLADLVGEATADEARRLGIDLDGMSS